MKEHEFHFPSHTGVCEITAKTFAPDNGEYDTVLVINHGMAEHMERYRDFAGYLCSNGVCVYIHDMANHGKSNTDYDLTGWFGEKDGDKGLIKDLRQMVLTAKKEDPGKKLIVMGHSMGSFICRLYTAQFPGDGINGAIFMGTGGPNPLAGLGSAAASVIGKIKGKKHKSRLLDAMAFGSYVKAFEKRTDYDWLTRDTSVVDRYIEDPYCGYSFTVQGMKDLVRVNVDSNSGEWFESVPKDLPMLIVSGEKDPVGDFSKGVDAVCSKLEETGHTRVTEKIYPGCRHEILNELNRDEVMSDILEWMRSI